MATDTRSITVSHTNDAEYRAWAEAISLQLTAVGMIKTADTGQVDWTTNPARPGTNTTTQYEIRYLNDSLHGTAPVYLKIEYGTGSSTISPATAYTWGSGSNGSGTITGVWQTRLVQAAGGTAWTTAQSIYACGWDGGFILVGGINSTGTNTGWCIFFDRTCDSAGALTTDGAIWSWNMSQSSGVAHNQNRWQRLAGTTGSITNSPLFSIPAQSATSETLTIGSDIYLGLAHIWFPGIGIRYPSGLMYAGATDFSANSTFVADGYDGSHTWRVYRGTGKILSGNYNGALCSRWE